MVLGKLRCARQGSRHKESSLTQHPDAANRVKASKILLHSLFVVLNRESVRVLVTVPDWLMTTLFGDDLFPYPVRLASFPSAC